MQTFTWEHDVVTPARRESFLFTYKVQADIVQALTDTGGTLDWSKHLYADEAGAYRLPAMNEHGKAGYLHDLSEIRDSDGLFESRVASPHGWGLALSAGLGVGHGDKVRIELTCFDSGRHLLQGWVTQGEDRPFPGNVAYSGIAHLGKDQDVLGRKLTIDQIRDLVADPTLSPPPKPVDPHNALREEMRELHEEFARRKAEIFQRHGVDMTPRPGFGPR